MTGPRGATREERIDIRDRNEKWQNPPLRIEMSECINCDACLRHCPPQFGAIFNHGADVVIVPELCSGCDKCLPACPVSCIYPDPDWKPAPEEWWQLPRSRARSVSLACAAVPDAEPIRRITRAEVDHVARLARLELTPQEADELTDQLEGILEMAARVSALDTADVPPTAHPLPLRNVLRADAPRPGLPRDAVLAEAPAAEDGRFRVPRILGEAE